MEDNICQMDCHKCTLQTCDQNKATCATLLMPAMINRLFALFAELQAGKPVNEVSLPAKELKSLKKNKDENIDREN